MSDEHAHLSALALDALALDALAPDARVAAEAHLVACARCRADADAGAAARTEFLGGGYARTLPAATAARPRRLAWPWLALPALLAAAAVVAVVVTRPPAGSPTEDELTVKGGPALQVFANRAGEVFSVRDGTRLAAGDRVRFVVEPDRAPYLLIASIDGAGAATVYYPYGGTASERLPAGDRAELPGSIVLDSAPGPERVYAIFSDQPVTASTVLDQLRAIGAHGPAAIRAARTLELAARAQITFVFEKATP